MAKVKGKAKLLKNTRLLTENGRGQRHLRFIRAQGGTNEGPTLELALMSLAGYGAIIYAEVCKKNRIKPETSRSLWKQRKHPIHP